MVRVKITEFIDRRDDVMPQAGVRHQLAVLREGKSPRLTLNFLVCLRVNAMYTLCTTWHGFNDY